MCEAICFAHLLEKLVGLATVCKDVRAEGQRPDEVECMTDRARLGGALFARSLRLVGIAKHPQGPGRIAEAMHPRVSPTIEKGQRVVPLRLIEGNALL